MIGKQLVRYVYIDIVGFTRPGRSVEFQSLVFRKLNEIIFRSIKDIPFDKRILLPTGDGVCFGLLPWEGRKHDADLALAADILERIRIFNGSVDDDRARFGVRIGLNEGEDDIVIDINGHLNFAGSGINMAQRIMDLADENQILAGVKTYERLSTNPDYRFKKYECKVKHEKTVVVYQLIGLGREYQAELLDSEDIAFYRMKKTSRYEKEYKFLIPHGEEEAALIYALFKGILGKTGSDLRISNVFSNNYTDTYLDDNAFTLHANGVCFRIRETDDDLRLIARKRISGKDAEYKRIEETAAITAMQAEDLKKGISVNTIPFRILPYIAPDCGKLGTSVRVECYRRAIQIADPQNRLAELSVDTVSYVAGDRTFGPYYEIDMENRDLPQTEINTLANLLGDAFGLIPSGLSRYERGISLLRTVRIDNTPKKVIIDTDCGVDDALALILALVSPELEVVGVTTVSGQVHVDKVTKNVFKVFDALDLEAVPPVARGADLPLKKPLHTAEYIHGEDGLGDAIRTVSERPVLKVPAWEFICSRARKHPNQITLITIGPMTNLALAIQNDPEGVHCLKDVVAMGGVFFEFGNIGPGTEFNLNTDPEAAYESLRFCRDSCLKIPVDNQGKPMAIPTNPNREDYSKIHGYLDHDQADTATVPLTFVGLDVAHKVLFRKSTLERAVKNDPDNKILGFIHKISGKYLKYCYDNEWLPGCYLYDPLAVGYVINPSFLDIEKHVIHVETEGSATSGMIFADLRPTRNPSWRNPAEEVVGIARNVEKEAFEEFFILRMIGDESVV